MPEGQHPSSGELQARAAEKIIREAQPAPTDKVREVDLQQIKLELEGERKQRWERIAVPEYAKELGLNPLTLSAEELRDVTDYGERIIKSAKKLGLNLRNLTSQERHELGYWGRVLTDAERKEKEEIATKLDKLRPKPLTPEEDAKWSQEARELRHFGRILTDAERKEVDELATKLTPEEWAEWLKQPATRKKTGVRATLTELFFSQPSPRNRLTADTDNPDSKLHP